MAQGTPNTFFGVLLVWMCSIGTLETMDQLPSEGGLEAPQVPSLKLPIISKLCNMGQIVNSFSVQRTVDNRTEVKIGCQKANYKVDSEQRTARLNFNLMLGAEHWCPAPSVIAGILMEPKGMFMLAVEISCVHLLTSPYECDWSPFKLFQDIVELTQKSAFTAVKYRKGRLEFKVCKI
ncbi:unnamed protein product [Lymnaea stagnalis]|uniref:Secreted protein n=1 Tax=Lymnaea stagnalis TaxID=6523 RepID=A0AAV2HU38_LYMST